MKTWAPDMRPVMMTDDIAFVGGTPVSVHCLISEEGLILLDTGYPGMLAGVSANLRALGLRLEDVRWVIHTHGHIDHYGGTAELIRQTGAKTLIGKEDAPTVRGERDLSWARELKLEPAETFTPDVLFSDGDVLHLGGRTIRCVHTPGHTEGTYTFFIDTKVNGQRAVAAMHGGAGMNSMGRRFLLSYGLPLSLRDAFRAGLHRVAKEHVDVVLGNHPQQVGMEEKIARMSEQGNPFVDASEWGRLLSRLENQLDAMLQKEQEAGAE